MPTIASIGAVVDTAFTSQEKVFLRMILGIPEQPGNTFYQDFASRLTEIDALTDAAEVRRHIRYLFTAYGKLRDDTAKLIDKSGLYWSGAVNRARLLSMIRHFLQPDGALHIPDPVPRYRADMEDLGGLTAVPVNYDETDAETEYV